MDPIGIFTGVSSGIDWRQLVEQIIELERRPIVRLETAIGNTQTKISALQHFRSLLDTLQTAATSFRKGSAFSGVVTTTTGISINGPPLIAAVAEDGTPPGSYQVEVLGLARDEKLGGAGFTDQQAALGLSGEFFVNGVRIQVNASDSLIDIRDSINDANSGENATQVTASVLTAGLNFHRLLLSSNRTGAEGIDLVETSDGILGQLGFVDGTTAVKHVTSDGAETDRFTARTTAIAQLLGLTGSVGSQNVTIGGETITIDLDTDSLDDIAAAIDAEDGLSASVQSTTLEDGTQRFYLDISGTTAFTDAGNALELLGVVEKGRSAVAQTVQGGLLSLSGGGPATANTKMKDIYIAGVDADVKNGDTLTITGTRGDGTAIDPITHTLNTNDKLEDLLDVLNDPSNFGPGVATIDATGRLVLTDPTAGDSQLSVSIVANNEGGGVLDFGQFTVSELGREREIVKGADAELRIDGVTMTRTRNEVTDAVPGLRLTLLTAEPGSFANVVIQRNPGAAEAVAQDFVEAYNEIVTFVKEQLVIDPESQIRPALYGDSALRLTRASLVTTLLDSIAGAASDLATASSVGISLKADGLLTLDSTKFISAVDNRYADVQRLFMERATTSDSQIIFVSSGGTTAAGTYTIHVTTAADRATVQGSGFSGTYSDDGTPDIMTVTESISGGMAEVQLLDGMTTQQIVDALNTAFQKSVTHDAHLSEQLYSDAGQSNPITEATTFDTLFSSGGTPSNVSAGDTITFSGTRSDGSTFESTFAVDSSDPANTTVGDLVTHLQGVLGTDVTVSVVDGRITVAGNDAGPSGLTFTATENNEGGGSLDFGTLDTVNQGRLAITLTAAAVGDEIEIAHPAFGSTAGFTIAYTPGGADNTGQLGLAAATYNGVDVAGTIDGHAATGSGQLLVADDGSVVEGLHISYTGSSTGDVGDITLALGLGPLLERQLEELLAVGTGLLDGREAGLSENIDRLEGRIDVIAARVETRRALLIRQFTAMETLLGRLGAQSAALTSQISSLSSLLGGRR